MIIIIFNYGDDVDYQSIISEKFPDCDVEMITPDVFSTTDLVEYITDDIVVFKPISVMVYSQLIRFVMNNGLKGKTYYLNDFSDDELKIIHAGLLKFTWKRDIKINLFKNANPDKEVLGL